MYAQTACHTPSLEAGNLQRSRSRTCQKGQDPEADTELQAEAVRPEELSRTARSADLRADLPGQSSSSTIVKARVISVSFSRSSASTKVKARVISVRPISAKES